MQAGQMKCISMESISNMPNKKILVVCVSLKESGNRRPQIESMISELKSLSKNIQIDFQFFDAVYGKKLAPEYLALINLSRQLAGQCKRQLGAAEIGCLLSHLFIWQRLVQGAYSSYDRIVIIEDDVTLNPHLIGEKLDSLVHESHPFAFLGGHTKQSRRRIRGFESKDNLYFNMTGPKDLYTATFAYSLLPSAADVFLRKLIGKISYVDDWKYLLSHQLTTPYYYCFDHNYEEISSIEVDRTNYARKPNRFRKNFLKMKNDLLSRLISMFVFWKVMRLSQFLEKTEIS